MSGGNRRKSSISGAVELICVTIIVTLVAVMMVINGRKLRAQEKAYTAQEEMLQKSLQEEDERTNTLNTRKKYVRSDEYIEEVAKEKLGLIKPDEVLLKEKE